MTTTWARLTWQAKDPDRLAADLARRLGVVAIPAGERGLAAGAWLLDLGTGRLEVRPWVREGPADTPRAAGRLQLEPVPGGETTGDDGEADARPLTLHAIAWSTVELDRAEADLGTWRGDREGDEGEDPMLGGRIRVRAAAGLPGRWFVLAEPLTEGRLAASLARDGEGPCALYLAPAGGLEAWVAAARERGVAVGGRRPGPFGAQAILPGPVTGPHVILAEGRPPVSGSVAPGTIAP